MTMAAVKSEPQSKISATQECAHCGQKIQDRYLLKALDRYWHEDCLKCGCCDCRLGEVGSSLYIKGNLILCKRDYLRLFGTTGHCAACNKVIPAFEMVMRAKNNVYHLECFACQQCNHRFCVGDRFFLVDNKILCEYDYEERIVFANLASYNNNNNNNNHMSPTPSKQPRLTPGTTHKMSNGLELGFGSESLATSRSTPPNSSLNTPLPPISAPPGPLPPLVS